MRPRPRPCTAPLALARTVGPAALLHGVPGVGLPASLRGVRKCCCRAALSFARKQLLLLTLHEEHGERRAPKAVAQRPRLSSSCRVVEIQHRQPDQGTRLESCAGAPVWPRGRPGQLASGAQDVPRAPALLRARTSSRSADGSTGVGPCAPVPRPAPFALPYSIRSNSRGKRLLGCVWHSRCGKMTCSCSLTPFLGQFTYNASARLFLGMSRGRGVG